MIIWLIILANQFFGNMQNLNIQPIKSVFTVFGHWDVYGMKGVKWSMMRKWNNDDLFYVCSMIEFVARETHNKTKDIVAKLSDKELAHQLKAAGVNHCLSFEQVCDEWIEEYGIEEGTFDNISNCKYTVPTVLSIGRVYQTLILNVMDLYENVIEAIKKVYSSFISEEISNFNSNVYYSNPDYIKCSYEAGMLLD